MLIRLRRIVGFSFAVAIGFVLASTAVAGMATDIFHMAVVSLAAYRLRAGSGGTVWMLLAGFLLGQALVITTQRLVATWKPRTAAWTEKAAAWDSALLLPTRYGVQCYLEACARWLAQERIDNTLSVGLFNITGVGRLNERGGNRAATALLERVARELRATTLASGASWRARMLARHFPRELALSDAHAPVIRCAARWSGSTFALAFRGIEAAPGLALVRDLAVWIRAELAALGPEAGLELRVAFVMSPAGASARSIADAADLAIAAADTANLTVATHPKDSRAPVFAAVPGLRQMDVPMLPGEAAQSAQEKAPASRTRFVTWLRGWGVVILCLAGVPAVMFVGAGSADFDRNYPWPASLTTIPVVDATGTSEVPLMRQTLRQESAGGWRVSGEVVQAAAGVQKVHKVEFRLDVTNLSQSARYVSILDFVAVDASGAEFEFDVRRIMKYVRPIDGRWLNPRETWSGWAYVTREASPVTALVFRPNADTRLELRTAP